MLRAQLDLWEAEVRRLPWEGVSPRALTRVAEGLFLSHKAQKHERFFVDPDQLSLELAGKGVSPVVYGGAPSLLPLFAKRS